MGFELDNYIDVAERLAIASEKYPEISLQFEWEFRELPDGQIWLVGKAYAYRSAEDTRPGIGTAWETYPGKTPYTRGSELMNLETSCWGRALAALAIETRRGIASKQEVMAAKDRQENAAPIAAPKPGENVKSRLPTLKQVQALSKMASFVGVPISEQKNFYAKLLGRDSIKEVTGQTASDLFEISREDWRDTAIAMGFKPTARPLGE